MACCNFSLQNLFPKVCWKKLLLNVAKSLKMTNKDVDADLS